MHEDDIEEDDLGKRIFLNIDDDNRNGIPDREDVYAPGGNATAGENDLARVEFATGLPFITDYRWMELRFTFDAGLRGWATAQKQGAYTPNVDGGGVYTIDLDGTDSAGFPNHLTVPNEFFVEGVSVSHRAFVTVELLRGTTVLSTDKIVFSVEKIVWPFANPPAGYQDDPTSDANSWIGIELNEGWFIDKALIDYIVNPADRGTIETVHPDRTTPHEARPRTVKGRADNDGELSPSTESYPNGFRAEIEYAFPHRDLNGYVQAVGKGAKLSLVGNSGVKFGANADEFNKPWEVAIKDVDGLFAEAGGDAAVQTATDANGNVDVVTPDYAAEPVNRLMTAVVYGGDYKLMKNNPRYHIHYAQSFKPADASEYYQTHLANNSLSDGLMVIDLKRSGVTWVLVVTLGGVETYRDNNFVPIQPDNPLGEISLQSHWGSGVRFNNMEVVRYE
ncbi:MAG: hypothetical protein WBD20_25855 [Pirellulaceae bacterium]